MTLIIGVLQPAQNRVIVGADRLVKCGDENITLSESKIWRAARFVVGVAGDTRYAQAMQFGVNWAALDTGAPIESLANVSYIVSAIVPAIKSTAEELGLVYVEENSRKASGHILIAIGPNVFDIGADFSVGCAVDKYLAIGSGGDWATGSLYTTRLHYGPLERAKAAMRASAYHCGNVGAPFDFMATGGEDFPTLSS